MADFSGPPSPPSSTDFSSRRAAGILFLATAVLFWKFLAPDTKLILSKFGEDMTADYIGWRQFAFHELKQGHLALWNTQLLCGAPFFGDFQSAILYPPNWLFMVLSLPFAVNLGIALHVFLIGWFTYLWITRKGSRPASALLGAFMVMFGGSYFLHIVPGHLPNLCSMAWIPLIFLALDGWRQKRAPGWILLGIFALSMQILAGHIQYVYYTVLVGGLYVFLILPSTMRKLSFLGGLLLIGIGAGAVTAVQLLAGFDAASESLRGSRLPIGIADIADMTPERLWCLLMPNFFGSWDGYWGGGFYWEGATFVSLTAFVLVLYALKKSNQSQKWVIGGLILFLILLSVGTRTPLFVLFYKYIPFFGQFRGVSKLNIFITLFLALLAAWGLDRVLDPQNFLRSLRQGTLWSSRFFFILAVIVWGITWDEKSQLFQKFGTHSAQILQSLLGAVVLLALTTLLAVLGERRLFWRYGFVILAFLELFFFAKDNLPSFDLSIYEQQTGKIEKVYQEDPGDYRVLVGNSYALSTSGKDIWGEDPVISSRFAKFLAQTQHCDPATAFLQKFTFREFPATLGLLRLKYRFEEEKGIVKGDKLPLRPAPRTFLADHWEVLKFEEVLSRVTNAGFEPTQKVFLESDPGIKRQDEGLFGSKVWVKDLSSDQLEVTAKLSKPGILVITDNYSKGWKAFPLGPPGQDSYQVLPANGFQRAVPLQAGSHHFILEYRPTAFVVGKWISLVAVLFYLSGCAWALLRKMTSNPRRGKIGV